MSLRSLREYENYIYIYQLDKYVYIPTFPENISDTLGSNFSTTNILARTAPIFSYSNSGPRTVSINLQLHRDMMTDVNYKNTRFLDETDISADYVDSLIRYLQAMALPSYNGLNTKMAKMVNPPMIAVRFGETLFIKGVVNSTVNVTYSGALDVNGKYQEIAVQFSVSEVDPQDANSIAKSGSFRGLNKVLLANFKRT